MKVIENLTKEQQELLDNYRRLEAEKKEIDSVLSDLKPTLLAMFKEPILDAKNQVKYSFSVSKQVKKTLNMERLLQFVSQEDLASCYDTKEIETTRITIGKIKE